MFKELKDIINKIISLSSELNEISDSDTKSYSRNGIINLGEIPAPSYDYISKHNELSNFLYDLDYETIKQIETIMFIGREIPLDSEETPEQIYNNMRNEANELKWSNKEGEIEYIISKAPLADYLKKGMRILKI